MLVDDTIGQVGITFFSRHTLLLLIISCFCLSACTQSDEVSTKADSLATDDEATSIVAETLLSKNTATTLPVEDQVSQKLASTSPAVTQQQQTVAETSAASSSKPAETAPKIVPSDPINSSVVKHQFDPNVNLSSVDWGQAIALGTVRNDPVPDSGIVGPAMSDGKTLRLGKVADPKGSGRQVIEYAAEYNADAAYRDPLFSDGTRVQVNHSLDAPGGLQRNIVNWHSFRVMHSDFGSGSDQQILMQYHDGDHSSGLNPYLAWLHKGDELTIFTKYSGDSSNIKANHKDGPRVVLSSPPNVWENWVVQSKVAENGFVKIWRNGELVMDYSGPFGYYNQPIGGEVIGDYAALSYYHWHSGNAFDTSVPIRRVWWEWSSIVEDSTNSYSFEDMYQHMESNIGATLPR